MRKIIVVVVCISLLSCKKKENSVKVSESGYKLSSKDSIDLIQVSLSTDNGKEINVIFNTSGNTASVFCDGEYIQLKEQNVDSGFYYKGEGYELSGNGDSLELKKDNVVIAKK